MPEERDTPSLEPPSLFGRKKKPTRPPKPVAPPPDDSPTTILDDASVPTTDLALDPPPGAEPVVEPVVEPASGPVSGPAPEPGAALDHAPVPAREPWLTGRPAAVLAGLVVGAVIVGATAGSMRICTQLKGTSSCGEQGFFLLVAILVAAVLLGTGLLRAARVPEPGSTSFLAVGLLSVVTLLFLVDTIFEWWMIIVIPLVSVATFLLSHWVATTYIDPT